MPHRQPPLLCFNNTGNISHVGGWPGYEASLGRTLLWHVLIKLAVTRVLTKQSANMV